jgi:predicted flavoprotein YhiN
MFVVDDGLNGGGRLICSSEWNTVEENGGRKLSVTVKPRFTTRLMWLQNK